MTAYENELPQSEEETALDEFLRALGSFVESAVEWARPGLKKGRFWLRTISVGIILWLVALVTMAWVFPASWRTTVIPSAAVAFPVVVLGAIAIRWPIITMVFAAMGTSKAIIRKILGWVLISVFFELAIGIYLSLVPINRAPELVPLKVSVPVAMAVLGISTMLLEIRRRRWVGFLMGILTLILIVLTIISFTGTEWVKEFSGGVNRLFERFKNG